MCLLLQTFHRFLESDKNEDLGRHISVKSSLRQRKHCLRRVDCSHVYIFKTFVFHICIAYQRYIQITQVSSYTGSLNILLIVFVLLEY